MTFAQKLKDVFIPQKSGVKKDTDLSNSEVSEIEKEKKSPLDTSYVTRIYIWSSSFVNKLP